MKINLKATNMELTSALGAYVEEKVGGLEKLLPSNEESTMAQVEIGKETNHHRQGEVFRAEVNLQVAGQHFYAVSMESDLYAAIDEVRDQISREIKTHFEKKNTLFRRGGRTVKSMLRGVYTYPLKGWKRLRRWR